MGQIQNFEDLVGFLRRHLRLIVAVTVIGAMASAIFARIRPDIYEPAHETGADTFDVLSSVAGLDAEEIAHLAEAGALT